MSYYVNVCNEEILVETRESREDAMKIISMYYAIKLEEFSDLEYQIGFDLIHQVYNSTNINISL